MGIDATWITENGEAKQEIFDPRQCITRLATARWHKLHETMCLRFIDPWGDAVFNQSQILHLLNELRSEAKVANEAEMKLHLDKIIRLVERAVDQTHTYIKFIGD